VSKYGNIQSLTAENKGGKNERRMIETTAAKYNGMPYWAAIISDQYTFDVSL